VAWLQAAGLPAGRKAPTAIVLREARALREAIDVLAVAAVEGGRADPAALATIDGWLVHAGERPALILRDGRPSLSARPAADSPRRALGTVALDAATMLGTDERERLRLCAAPNCRLRFFDRSPAGARRWCSMATCGNVAKARRHRARSGQPA